jgi:hypothetical protein
MPLDNILIVLQAQDEVMSLVPPDQGWEPGAQPAMALWSPTSETLYYRQGSDVWRWTPLGGAQRFLDGVTWQYPTISPDGSQLAYQVSTAGGPRVFLVDLVHGGRPQPIGDGARKWPVFLNSTQLWFRSVGVDHGCVGSEDEGPLIYNILDRSESPSIIDQVLMVWPATSSNH